MNQRMVWLGGFLFTASGLLALLAPALSPYDVNEINVGTAMQSPSLDHWFGTDQLGRDLFARTMAGGRASLLIGLGATALATTIGVVVGTSAGYFGRRSDAAVSGVTDIALAFPALLLAAVLVMALGNSPAVVVLILAAVGWPLIARTCRASVAEVKQRSFVEAAVAGGSSPGRVLQQHVLPHALPVVIALAVLSVGRAILTESALAFLAVGLDTSQPSWGAMVADGRRFLVTEPHLVLFPSLAIALTVGSLVLITDGIRSRVLQAR